MAQGVTSLEALANPNPLQSNVAELYQATLGFTGQAVNALESWKSFASLSGAKGYAAYEQSLKAGKQVQAAAKKQADAYLMAGAAAGITANSVYKQGQQQIASIQGQAEQYIASQRQSYAGAGLTLTGSPSQLLKQSAEGFTAQQRVAATQLNLQERVYRQQQENQRQMANQTIQTASQQSNLLATQGQQTWYWTQLESAMR
jgi:hypothetical protein